jgi:hypothetical protein
MASAGFCLAFGSLAIAGTTKPAMHKAIMIFHRPCGAEIAMQTTQIHMIDAITSSMCNQSMTYPLNEDRLTVTRCRDLSFDLDQIPSID